LFSSLIFGVFFLFFHGSHFRVAPIFLTIFFVVGVVESASTQGTTWGLGGTCVNVGCVPKKLMHYAGIMGNTFHNDAHKFGWNFDNLTHDWVTLRQTVQNHVKSLNFAYRNGLRSNKVTYINSFARFSSSHEVVYELKGVQHTVSAANFLIACGGRPSLPDDVPGAKEHAITSDDVFSLEQSPGKTLCVGGSYIALECAGFLTELGHDTTVAVRSIVLRGFDRQCSEKIAKMMAEFGTNFKYGFTPASITKQVRFDFKFIYLCIYFNLEKIGPYLFLFFLIYFLFIYLFIHLFICTR
jgi:pyruvate/2-oxoglutarate dehydrogenase complex dihydrolipoamide dehydrogenase (E3) component